MEKYAYTAQNETDREDEINELKPANVDYAYESKVQNADEDNPFISKENSTKYISDFAIDTDKIPQYDYTRSNTNLLTQITSLQNETTSFVEYMKMIKKSFKKWKKQYKGLTCSEAIAKFMYNISHTGITIATIIYCVVFIVVVISAILSDHYHTEYIIIASNCVIGIISLLFNVLPMILIFDYISSCCGIGFMLNSSWRINDGYSNTHYPTLVIFGLAMVLIVPFRICWWHKFYPNKWYAMEIYTDLHEQGYFANADDDDVDNETDSTNQRTMQQTVTQDSLFYN